MAKLSALLIVYNEKRHLPDVIEQLDFVDEIIIIDSFSTDGSFEILKKLPQVKVFQNSFKDYASQRNFAISKAQYEWVLFIDADERIPKKLKAEILKTIDLAKPRSAYKFKRQYLFKGKKLHFSGMQTDKAYRLFQKGKANYSPDHLVHEQLRVTGTTGILEHKLLHYFYHDYHIYKEKMIAYGRLKGKELFLKNKTCTWFHRYLKPLYKFFRHYFLRLGVLDGKKGLIISYINMLSVVHRYKELRRLNSLSPKQ